MLTRLFAAVIALTAAGDDSPAYQWARADVGAVDELPRGTLLTQHKISFVDASGVQREPLLTLRVGDDVSARVNTLCARVNTTISPLRVGDAGDVGSRRSIGALGLRVTAYELNLS